MEKINNTISNYTENVDNIHAAVDIEKKTKDVDVFLDNAKQIKDENKKFTKKSKFLNMLSKQFNHAKQSICNYAKGVKEIFAAVDIEEKSKEISLPNKTNEMAKPEYEYNNKEDGGMEL